MALDALAMSSVGLLFGWVAVLAHPDGARRMRADAQAQLAAALAQLRG